MTDVQAELDRIRAEAEARQAAADAAREAEESRVSALVAAKEQCAAQCGPIADALADITDPAERALLAELEARTHEGHAAALAEAYLAFSGQREGDSNPADPGITDLTAEASAVGGVTAG
jgi:hypothetical protein